MHQTLKLHITDSVLNERYAAGLSKTLQRKSALLRKLSLVGSGVKVFRSPTIDRSSVSFWGKMQLNLASSIRKKPTKNLTSLRKIILTMVPTIHKWLLLHNTQTLIEMETNLFGFFSPTVPLISLASI